MKGPNKKLTLKQQKFINKYLETGNATLSAKFAGYSPRTAYSQGQRLLKNVEIQDVLAEHLEKEGITDKFILDKLKYLAEKGKENTRVRALEILAKIKGLLKGGELAQIQMQAMVRQELDVPEELRNLSIEELKQKVLQTLEKLENGKG